MIRFMLLVGMAYGFSAASAPASAQSIRDDMWVTNGFVYTNTILNNTMYIGGLFNRIGPATGGFMPTDATTGRKTMPGLGVDGAVNAIVPDGSGGFILGGSFKHFQGVDRASIARVDASGNLLPWNPGVNGIVNSLAIGGGRVYMGGDFSEVGGLPRSNLAAVDLASAAVSTTWVPNADNTVYYVGYLNGLVYIGGEFFGIAGTQRAHGGSFDGVTGAPTQWQPNTDGAIYTMALRYDVLNVTTFVYIGGNFTVCGGAFRRNFALLDATVGSPNFSSATTFDPSPDGTVRVIRTVGNTIPTIYVGGEFQNIAGNSRPHLCIFQGTTLTSFNPAPDGTVVALAPGGGGTLYIGGSFLTVDHALRGYAALVSTSTGGVLPWDAAAGNVVRAFAQSGSTMWIGGDFTTIGALGCGNLAAIDLTTGKATTWNPVASGPVYALESIGGWLYAGGQFVALGGQGHLNIARVDTNGNADANWSPITNQPVFAIAGRALAPSGNMIYFGGPFTTCNGQPRNRIAAIADAAPAVLSTWNPNAGTNGDVRAIAIDGSYVYVGGTFPTLGGLPIAGLGRIDFNGVVSSWDPNTQQPILGITLTPTTVYVGFPGVNNFPGGQRIGVAEIDKTTAMLTVWNPGTDPAAVVYAIRRNGNTVYVGGLINVLGGQPRSMLGAVDAVSGAALSFAPSPSAWLSDTNPPLYYQLPAVIDMEEDNGRLYAVGQFTNTGGKPHSGVVGIFESLVSVSSPALASGVALRAMPNPSAGAQAFSFTLSSGGAARVTIRDAGGRLVRTLSASLPAGPQRLDWDGRAASGAPAPPGLYFARLEAAGAVATIKVVRSAL